MKVSICIPTYNRASQLRNCLHSIAKNNSGLDFQVCVSDNGSTDNTELVVREAQSILEIKYHRNPKNLGLTKNFLNVVSMADGEFAWLLGDDDLLLPNTIEELYKLMTAHPKVDFFYVNSYHLSVKYLESFPQPFDTLNLPKTMKAFSSHETDGEMKFLDLIDPKISFDFLGGMYLAVFRRQNWLENAHAISEFAASDPRIFSFFDNTFPHVKIFSRAFATSLAFFSAAPLSVNLSGVREWAPMYPLVRSVRLIEALDEYRSNGLSESRYRSCRNYALGYFIPDLVWMFLHRKISGFQYIRFWKLIFSNCMYSNFYLSFFSFAIRKLKHGARNA